MCDLNADYSTIVGPGRVLEEVGVLWGDLRTTRRFALQEPDMVTLSRVGHHWDADAPTLLTVPHAHVPGHLIADELNSELNVERGFLTMTEPGYGVGLASAGFSPEQMFAGPWQVDFNDEALRHAAEYLTHSSGEDRERNRVAVIDSGSDGPFMIDMLEDQPNVVEGADDIGHGTAVSSLILAMKPTAEIYPIRVLRQNPGESRHLLLGLIAALWPDEDGSARYDVVNVSITRQLVDECSTSLGATLRFVHALCSKRGTIPPVVAAAGNKTAQQEFGYPAAFPDAVAAIGLDWRGNPADYNVQIPAGTNIVAAFGGTQREPYGQVQREGGEVEALYGSSFAAALISCKFLMS